ncbi:MAG: J domain-containing protein [Phormidesmis sp.]
MIINEGLFKLDVTDHHAVLGFSLVMEPAQVRKRYLKVARQLHPDSLQDAADEQKRLASELLSKWVNPAYEALSQNKLAKEHHLLLSMKQRQLVARPILLSAQTEAAKKLLGSSQLEQDYTALLQKITATQFDDFARVDIAIGTLSELNAVYLMRKGTVGAKGSGEKAAGGLSKGQMTSEQQAQVPRRPRHEDIIESYLGRAKEFDYKQDYSRAILELREAIAAHPQSAPCHSYLSSLYLKVGQATLAKIHAKQALAFDSSNEQAKAVQAKLGNQPRAAASAKGGKGGTQKGAAKSGGLLSGLFGGKKG